MCHCLEDLSNSVNQYLKDAFRVCEGRSMGFCVTKFKKLTRRVTDKHCN